MYYTQWKALCLREDYLIITEYEDDGGFERPVQGNLKNGLREETMGIDFRHCYKNLGPSYKARNMV